MHNTNRPPIAVLMATYNGALYLKEQIDSILNQSLQPTIIIVSDDGPGALVEQITSGLGTSIIDSWVGILNGSKEIDSAPGHGYQLHVTFIAH